MQRLDLGLDRVVAGGGPRPMPPSIQLSAPQKPIVHPRSTPYSHPYLCLASKATALQVDHAHQHAALRIAWQVFKAKCAIELTHPIVDRVRQHAEASHVQGEAAGGRQGIPHEGSGVAFALMALIDGQLAEQDRRQWAGLVPLGCLRQKFTLNLRGAE